jgi:hypothetical protein
MCYRHNLTGLEDGPTATWAEGGNRDGLRIDFCASVLRAGMAVCLSKDSLNMVRLYRNQLGLVKKIKSPDYKYVS